MRKLLPILLSMSLTLIAAAANSPSVPGKKAGTDAGHGPETLTTHVVQPGPKVKNPLDYYKLRQSGNPLGTGLQTPPERIKTSTWKHSDKDSRKSNVRINPDLEIWGEVVYANGWPSFNPPRGYYTIPLSQEDEMELQFRFVPPYYGLRDNYDGTYTGVYYEMSLDGKQLPFLDKIRQSDAYRYESNSVKHSAIPLTCALDPVTDELYGYFTDEERLRIHWGRADWENGTSTTIHEIQPGEVPMMSVSADDKGNFFGVSANLMGIYSIDKNTGATTLLHSFEEPLPGDLLAGGVLDPKTGTYYQTWCYSDNTAGMIAIDMATGETTPVCTFPNGEEILCLHIHNPLADNLAPSLPTFNATCSSGSTAVDFSIVMPMTHFDGSSASGEEMNYEIMMNGETIASGYALAGDEIWETRDIPTNGYVSFIAIATNSHGASPKARARCFVGQGTPAAPENIHLTWDNGIATMTWNPVKSSVNGEYINPATVTYTVTDMNGNILSDNQSTTSFTAEALEQPVAYNLKYYIRSNCNGKSSSVVASNAVCIGTLEVPVKLDLEDKDNFDIHTVLNANNDNQTWEHRPVGAFTYSWNSDDWLFSPGIRMEKGKAYKLIMNAMALNYGSPERFEIKAGREITVQGMNLQVIAPTVTTRGDDNDKEFEGYVVPDEDGIYHIGFHIISDDNGYSFGIFNYEITPPIDASAPKAVADLHLESSTLGFLEAEISFTMPEMTIGNTPLTENVSVKVYRDDTLIQTVTDTPGAAVFLNDEVSDSGTYLYKFVTYNSKGIEGESELSYLYIGSRTPSAPENVRMKEIDSDTFEISWDPVTTDIYGNPINPDDVKYLILTTAYGMGGLYPVSLVGTTYNNSFIYHSDTHQSEQGFFSLIVVAENNGVDGGMNVGSCWTGDPYEMPVSYSKNADLESHAAGLEMIGDGEFVFINENDVENVNSQDEDGEFFTFQYKNIGDMVTFISGSVTVSGSNPSVSLYVYPLSEGDSNSIIIFAEVENERTVLLETAIDDYTYNQWNNIIVPLSQFKGKNIRIGVMGICNLYNVTCIDNISIYDAIEYDLEAEMEVPAKVKVNEPFNVSVKITNKGTSAAQSYILNLYRDDKLINSFKSENPLQPSASKVMDTAQVISHYDNSETEYHAEVIFDQDLNPDNNVTPIVIVTRTESHLPTVTGLEGTSSSEGNLITWDPVEIEEEHIGFVTESFEDIESWTHEIEGWTLIDADDSPIGGIGNLELPGIEIGRTKSSFFVFDSTIGNETYASNTGDKCLVSMFRYDHGQSDDWLISPKLSGNSQTISFYAKSYLDTYPEEIELYFARTEDMDVNGFIKAKSQFTIPGEWTEFTMHLPSVATHFAIRTRSKDAFMLMIDDITFETIVVAGYRLLGYNVYCDGQRLNDTPVETTFYLHMPTEKDHIYHVTAVFDKGESNLSEALSMSTNDVNQLISDGKIKVIAKEGYLKIIGATGLNVGISSADGKSIHVGKGDCQIAVNTGIYLVSIADKTIKVAIK